jgi:hypothetical protein
MGIMKSKQNACTLTSSGLLTITLMPMFKMLAK